MDQIRNPQPCGPCHVAVMIHQVAQRKRLMSPFLFGKMTFVMMYLNANERPAPPTSQHAHCVCRGPAYRDA
jgi:hypothetical protein